ncbi:uncharacterized protein EI90DRAFT_3074822 [Cantharellus anzutake]|uniref:uncharacterized protein n=1 Tax=Cantharellus anzutake TaxID=1750568 RepID=UPI0019072B37|nr:uncharacterized protein EI90DRAFT_3074822 [Cantharellus anzutake]KAF8324700.1 hypothetical protein EI90DRAFT_3074822 [Cantharellus anzutake]
MPSFFHKLACGLCGERSAPLTPHDAPIPANHLLRPISPENTMVGAQLNGLQVIHDGTKNCRPDSNGSYRAAITIKNQNPRGTDPIIFKMMVNVHNVYVRPNRGLLMPGDLLSVQVRKDEDSKNAQEKPPSRKSPKLLVKSTFVPPRLLRRYGEHNLVDIWNHIERDGYTQYETWCIRLPKPRTATPSHHTAPSIHSSITPSYAPNANNPNSESLEIARLRQENAQLKEQVASMRNGVNLSNTNLSLYPVVSDIGAIGPRYYPPHAPQPQVIQSPQSDQISLAGTDMDYFDAPVPSYEEATGRSSGIRRLPQI